MPRFPTRTAPATSPRPSADRRATIEPMEGRVLRSATPIGNPVTFTYTVTNPSPAAADSVSAGPTTRLGPDGKQLVVTIKGGPE